MTPRGRDAPRRGRHRRLQVWDRLWVRRGQNLRIPEWLDRLLIFFVKLGDGWGWLPIAGLFAVILPLPRFFWIAGQGLFAVCISLPLYWVLKASFRRTRPHALFKRVSARVAPRDAYSFPSGHTMNNLAIAASLAFHLPWLWPLALALPVALGLLRVVFGVHFVSDIVGGTVCGLLAAWAAVAFYPYLFG
jgi:undecaprenyl-diphosphatase